MLKTIRSKLGSKISKDDEMDGPYKRQTRSMDIHRNPFMSQPSLRLQRPGTSMDDHSSRTTSSSSNSPVPLTMPTFNTFGQAPGRLEKSESMPAKQRPNHTNGTAITVTIDPVSAGVRPGGTEVPDIIVSESRIPTENVSHGGRDHVTTLLKDHTSKSAKNVSATTFSIPSELQAAHPSALSPSLLSVGVPTSSRSRPRSRSSSPAPKVPSHRPPQIANIPPPAFRLSKEGSVRLSPSIITRPAPMPLHLPKIPAPSGNLQSPPPKPQSRLRSMPALSVDGTNELDREADHDNAVIGDSDEEDDGDETHGGSDEEGDDLTNTRSSYSSQSDLRTAVEPAQRPSLPLINTTPFDISFPTFKSPSAGPSGVSRQEEDATPTAHRRSDYFSIDLQPGPNETPRVTVPKQRPSTSPSLLRMPSTSSGLARPVMYHQASKSMVNILSTKQELPPLKEDDEKKSLGKGKGKAPAKPDTPDPATPENSEGTGLRRQRSMPIFNAASEPPPYPTFARRDNVTIMPRDDEGRERLPEYSNAIHLTAIMPRKMEFSAPGIQAKDRKWRRTLCELQGTAFRVYKCPAGLAGGGVIGEWWEKKVGVGDVAVPAAPVAAVPTSDRSPERPPKDTPESRGFSSVTIPSGSRIPGTHLPQPQQTTAPQKPRRLTAATLLHPIARGGSSPAQSRSHARSQSEAPGPSSNEGTPRSSLNISLVTSRSSSQLNTAFASSSDRPMTPSNSSPDGSAPPSASRSSFFPRTNGRSSVSSFTRPTPDVLCPDPADLIRTYTLQNAESGLGNDYIKRKNVIRVRMEGEQFLLQAQDVADVVEWIEVRIGMLEWDLC